MGLFDILRRNKKQYELPLIAKRDFTQMHRERTENQELGEVSILSAADYTKRLPSIRLVWVSMSTFPGYASETRLGTTYGLSSPFLLPRGMTYEQAYKVVSYLSEKVEKEHGLQPCTEQGVGLVSQELSKYYFDKVACKSHGHFHETGLYFPLGKIESSLMDALLEEQRNVKELFTISGNAKLFRRTRMHDRYFEWFTPGVTKEEIAQIYDELNYAVDETVEYFSDEKGDE